MGTVRSNAVVAVLTLPSSSSLGQVSSMQPICVVGSPHVSTMAMARSESVAESVCIEGAGDYAVLLCVACVVTNGAVAASPTYRSPTCLPTQNPTHITYRSVRMC